METEIFDGEMAVRGYALNKLCFSLNDAACRDAFRADEEAYFDRFGLTEVQKAAVRSRNIRQMLEVGGNVYYLAKLAGVFGLGVQDIGAQQTGVTVEAFKQRLLAQAEG